MSERRARSERHPQRSAPPPPRPRRASYLGLLVAGLLLVAATTAGCGESDADKAHTQVCDAIDDVKKQVDDLSGLTLSTATVDGVKSDLNAIKDDLNQIKDAQGNLSGDRKQEVESANQQFASEVEAVAAGVGSDLSLADAKSKLEASLRQLGSSYEQTFAQVDCGN